MKAENSNKDIATWSQIKDQVYAPHHHHIF